MPGRNAHQQALEVVFHEPDPDKPALQLVQGPAKRPRPERARTIEQPHLSSKIDSDTNWRLSIYCKLTGYGVKDAVVSAATGYLGWGPYPRRIPLDRVREAASSVVFKHYNNKKPISVRLDPALIDAIKSDAEMQGISESFWVEEALGRLFDHMHLPSKKD